MTQTTIEACREVTTIDEIGRTICTQYKDFWAYVEKKKTTKQELLKLNPDRREDFFMKWKHGMSDMNSNWDFEYSLRSFLKSFNGMPLDAVDPYFRQSVNVKRGFEEYCDKIKTEIGIYSGRREVPDEIKQLTDQVGGTVVNYAEAK